MLSPHKWCCQPSHQADPSLYPLICGHVKSKHPVCVLYKLNCPSNIHLFSGLKKDEKNIFSWEIRYPPKKALLKMMFLFPRWDMLVPWRVYVTGWMVRFLIRKNKTNTDGWSNPQSLGGVSHLFHSGGHPWWPVISPLKKDFPCNATYEGCVETIAANIKIGIQQHHDHHHHHHHHHQQQQQQPQQQLPVFNHCVCFLPGSWHWQEIDSLILLCSKGLVAEVPSGSVMGSSESCRSIFTPED